MKHLRHCASTVAGPCTCTTTHDYPRGKRNQPPRAKKTKAKRRAATDILGRTT